MKDELEKFRQYHAAIGADHYAVRLEKSMRRLVSLKEAGMNKGARNRLGVVLEEMQPEKLRGLNKDTLAKKFSENYAELDYIHPFYDGNSRTLREFFAQSAEEIGYTLKLDRELKFERYHFYKARDRAVLEKTYTEEPSENFRNKIADILPN